MTNQTIDHPDSAVKAGTRERILQAARTLFWERGYNGTSLQDILQVADAKSGSFYHFFESKDALLQAVLDLYITSLVPVLIEPAIRATPGSVDRVFAVLEGYRASLVQTNCTYGCPIGRLALEIDPESSGSMELIAANFRGWTMAIADLLSQERSQFPPNTDFVRLARLVLAVMEGGVMQARAQRSLEPFDAAVGELRRYFELLVASKIGNDAAD